jgi:amino acid transporter
VTRDAGSTGRTGEGRATGTNLIERQRTTLRGSVTYYGYLAMGFGTIVGMGWIVYAGTWLRTGGPLGSILAFVLGGLLVATIGKCYAELTAALPVAGGDVAFAYKAFGSNVAFTSAWLLVLAYTVLCPFETVSVGWLAEAMLTPLRTSPLYTMGHQAVTPLSLGTGVGLAVLVTVLNLRGAKSAVSFQIVAALGMVLLVVGLAVLAAIQGHYRNLLPLLPVHSGPILRGLPLATLSVLAVVPFFLSGFSAVPQAAEEREHSLSPKQVGRVIVLSVAAAAGFYVIVILTVAFSMPWTQAVGLEMPPADVFRVAFGHDWASRLVLLAGFLGIATTLNGALFAASRLLFAAGRAQLLPQWFGQASVRGGIPRNATLFVGLFALAGPFVGKAVLSPIVNIGSVAFSVGWFITCLAALRLRSSAPDMPRPYRVRHFGTLVAGSAAALVLAALLLFPGSPECLSWPGEYATLLVWVALGVVARVWSARAAHIPTEEQERIILKGG